MGWQAKQNGWLIVLFLVGLVPASWAAGPTSEDEYIRDFTSGRYPLTLSGDGRWRFHADDLKRLHRVAIAAPENEQTLELPEVARNVSASYAGDKLAFSTFSGCIGVVTYTDTSTTLETIQWLEYDEKTGDYQRDYCLNGDGDTKPGQGNYQVAAPVALSSDGKRIALKTPAAVVLVDLASRKIVDQFPTDLDEDSKSVMSLQWLDHDNKLLVTKLMLGEGYESASEGSNVQISVVDVATKKSVQHYETALSGTLPYYQLLWFFAKASGLLWGMDGEMYKDNPTLYWINLKSCNPSKHPVLTTIQQDWVDVTADPQGRWIAVVERAGRNDDRVASPSLQLVLYSVKDAKKLAAWPLQTPLRSLQPSSDGNWLYATTAGETSGEYDAPYTGGGEVMTFNVSPRIVGLASLPEQQGPEQKWPDQACASTTTEQPDESSLPFGIFPAEAMQKEGITILATAEPAADGWHALVCSTAQCVLHATPMTVITKLVRSRVKAGDVTLAAGEKPLVLLRGKPLEDGKVVPTYLSELMPPSMVGPTLGTLGAIIKTPLAGEFQVVPRLSVNAPAPAPVDAVAPSTAEGNQPLTGQETAPEVGSEEGSAEGEVATPPEKIVNLYLEQGTQRQLLFSFDYKALVAMVRNSEFALVLWAGDLDGDGMLDLVTRQPVGEMYDGGGIGRYTFTHLHLWLSSLAGKDEMVGQAATLDPAQENADDLGM